MHHWRRRCVVGALGPLMVKDITGQILYLHSLNPRLPHFAVSTTNIHGIVIPCSNGIPGVQSGDICCSAECGTCGGTGCSGRPGGGEECCTGPISLSSVMCSESGAAPCIID